MKFNYTIKGIFELHVEATSEELKQFLNYCKLCGFSFKEYRDLNYFEKLSKVKYGFPFTFGIKENEKQIFQDFINYLEDTHANKTST